MLPISVSIGGSGVSTCQSIRFPYHEDGLPQEGIFEGLEGLFLADVPGPLGILLSEIVQRACELSKVLDESAVEVSKPEKSP